MNFLGMGPGELFVILILALIVFGPSKLPEIGSSMGRAISEFRRASSQLSEELSRELRAETPTQEPARAEDPVVLEPVQVAPHEVSLVDMAPSPEEPAQAAAVATPLPLMPEDMARIRQLETELEMKKAMNALEIKRLEVELEARRLEAELAARKVAAQAGPAGVAAVGAEPATVEAAQEAPGPETVAEAAARPPERVEAKGAEPEAQVMVADAPLDVASHLEPSNGKGD